ncbi:hypothetical protein B484DRAFT_112827, partial [Ochromonadaceae sp. CCMP2298]
MNKFIEEEANEWDDDFVFDGPVAKAKSEQRKSRGLLHNRKEAKGGESAWSKALKALPSDPRGKAKSPLTLSSSTQAAKRAAAAAQRSPLDAEFAFFDSEDKVGFGKGAPAPVLTPAPAFALPPTPFPALVPALSLALSPAPVPDPDLRSPGSASLHAVASLDDVDWGEDEGGGGLEKMLAPGGSRDAEEFGQEQQGTGSGSAGGFSEDDFIPNVGFEDDDDEWALAPGMRASPPPEPTPLKPLPPRISRRLSPSTISSLSLTSFASGQQRPSRSCTPNPDPEAQVLEELIESEQPLSFDAVHSISNDKQAQANPSARRKLQSFSSGSSVGGFRAIKLLSGEEFSAKMPDNERPEEESGFGLREGLCRSGSSELEPLPTPGRLALPPSDGGSGEDSDWDEEMNVDVAPRKVAALSRVFETMSRSVALVIAVPGEVEHPGGQEAPGSRASTSSSEERARARLDPFEAGLEEVEEVEEETLLRFLQHADQQALFPSGARPAKERGSDSEDSLDAPAGPSSGSSGKSGGSQSSERRVESRYLETANVHLGGLCEWVEATSDSFCAILHARNCCDSLNGRTLVES